MRCLRSFVSTVVAFALVAGMAAPAYAGDILRGGSPLNSPRRTASSGAGPGTDNANQARTNARDRLARTTQLTDAMRAMQLAARNAAARPGTRISDPNRPGKFLPRVPDGLRRGGLQVAPGVPIHLQKPRKGENPALWTGANLPVESRNKGGVEVTIKQTEQQALLNWETFNVGKKTTLHFDQTAGGSDASKWIAFNKVNDPSGRPSQILGKMKAEGQVYVINQNGIIFGGGSQVNVHTLTASALPINENLITRGLLDNPAAEFLFDAHRSDNLNGVVSAAAPSAVLSQIVDPRSRVRVKAVVNENNVEVVRTLVPGEDYTLTTGKDRRSTITLTEAGLAKAVNAQSFVVVYDALNGKVVTQRGAQLTSPTSAAKVGGRIALVGSQVANRGTISTPDGQTILAAGLQVGFDAHRASDPSIRGLDVYVGSVADPVTTKEIYAGSVTNTGLIEVPRGNATITGRNVRQLGAIDASTSVSLNGSVNLIASYDAVSNTGLNAAKPENGGPFVYQSTGIVTLGEDSVTRILPELDSDESVIGTELALSSRIDVQGHIVHLEKNALMLAPNARVNLAAGKWYFTPAGPTPDDKPPRSVFVYTSGQIYADHGAMIDVAGTTDVFTPLSHSILNLQFRGVELADSPLQRDGLLRGTDLTIDIRNVGTFNGLEWVGTPLADATGFVKLIQRNVGQLTTAGGSVNLQAGGSVVLQKGSIIDVSGGWVHHEAGFIETSQVVSGNRLLDIADATPDIIYDGFYTAKFTDVSSKWGVVRTFAHPLSLFNRHYESGYIAGRDGGSVAITAPSMALDGRLEGKTVGGPRQVRNAQKHTELPATSALSLKFEAQDPTEYPFTLLPTISPKPPRIYFADKTQQAADAFAVDKGNPLELRKDRARRVYLSPRLFSEHGFSFLAVENSDGRISLPAASTLEIGPSGKRADGIVTNLDLRAANIDLAGDIIAPAAKLNFTVFDFSPYRADILLTDSTDPDFHTPDPDPDRGNFILRRTATINLAGLIADDRADTARPFETPIVTNGGSISIAAYDVRLDRGSVMDVSGGAAMTASGKVSFGDAGSIAIKAGQDPKLESLLGGGLVLESTLRGYSGTSVGGGLSIQAPQIRIGKETAGRNQNVFSPAFFDRGGFSRFSFAGIGAQPRDLTPDASPEPTKDPERAENAEPEKFLPGLVVEAGTVIDPRVQSWFARPYPLDADRFTLEPTLEIESLRPYVTFDLAAKGVTDSFTKQKLVRGDLVIGNDVSIDLPAHELGRVALTADTISVNGSIRVPGGAISVTGAKSFPELTATPLNARTTVYLGPRAILDVSGEMVRIPDDFGRRRGRILPGGSINIFGNILAERSSRLDVSGARGMLDFTPAELGLNAFLADAGSAAPSVPVTSGVTTPLSGRISVATAVDSNGGAITLTGGEQLVFAGKLDGAAGGPTAVGGSLAVSSGHFQAPNTVGTPKDVTLEVSQEKARLHWSLPRGEKRGVGYAVQDGKERIIDGRGYFSVDLFETGRFDSLSLGGVVRFAGPVDIAARQKLSVASGGVIYADHDVRLTAPYVVLGTPFLGPLGLLDPGRTQAFDEGGQPFFFRPKHGDGRLTVRADLIDIGNLSLQNIGRARLIADGGDIRGDGTLQIAGSLYLRAGQVYPASGVSFTLAALSYRGEDFKPGDERRPGTITVAASGNRQLPLSAGGELNLYATKITQGGTLRAPMGTIRLGWDGTGEAPKNLISGKNVDVAERLTLAGGSETSVTAADRGDGTPLLLPYGVLAEGTSWIDLRGIDITAGGVPAKDVKLGARNLVTEPGSTIDLRGGGDLLAYRFVKGDGGTRDILASDTSFAVLPGYEANFAPFAPYNTSTEAGLLNGDPGYVNATLKAGDRVYLGASNGLAAGVYTLLPARYALLPGAVLVTPTSGSPVGTIALPDGSSLVSGYRFNDLNSKRTLPALRTQFEVAPASVVHARAEYELYSANAFLRQSALELDATIPRLPVDSGHLVFQAVDSLDLRGAVSARPPVGGIGAYIDISSPGDILITGSGNFGRAPAGTLSISAANLSSFDAESLLIGGVRSATDLGAEVDVTTRSITVDNAGSPLSAPEIILTANEKLNVAPGSIIEQKGSLSTRAENLIPTRAVTVPVEGDFVVSAGGGRILFTEGTLGTSGIVPNVGGSVIDATGTKKSFLAGETLTLAAGSTVQLDAAGSIRIADGEDRRALPVRIGDGVLLRVSGDPNATSTRSVAYFGRPEISVGRGAILSGTSLTLDSSAATALDRNARLLANYVSLNSGRISILLGKSESAASVSDGLILAGNALRDLQGVQGLSLLSYSSIDVYGRGALTIDGKLELHAGGIRGFNGAGESAAFRAGEIRLDNRLRTVAPASAGEARGTLEFAAETIRLGAGNLAVSQYATLELNASRNLFFETTGRLFVDGDIVAKTPYINAAGSASGSLVATGDLDLLSAGAVDKPLDLGLGASLRLRGDRVRIDTDIFLPSGEIAARASSGDLIIGGRLDVSGSQKRLYDLTRFTGGGLIDLTASRGSVNVKKTGELSVAAPTGGGNAGALVVSTPRGRFNLEGTLSAQSGKTGQGGSFAVDVSTLPRTAALTETLDAAGFSESRSFRVRRGDVLVDGTSTSRNFDLSADAGDITVSGLIDASGVRGGDIDLRASGSLTLLGSARLTVAAKEFDAAGKGGAISLEAGAAIDGTSAPDALLDLRDRSVIDLSVAARRPDSADRGQFAGTLHLRAPQNAAGTDVQIETIASTIRGASSIIVEGFRIFDLTGTSGVITIGVQNAVRDNGIAFIGTLGTPDTPGTPSAGYQAMHDRLLAGTPNAAAIDSVLSIRAGAEIINRAGDLTLGTANSNGGQNWDLNTLRFGPQSAPGILTLRASGDLVFFNALQDGFNITTKTSAYTARLMDPNQFLPGNAQSWSFRLTAGADFSAADFHRVLPTDRLDPEKGMLLLGKNAGNAVTSGTTGTTGQTRAGVGTSGERYQVIRTGSGDIDISTARDLRLLNQFATIYTAGTLIADPTMKGEFDVPILNNTASGLLGSIQQSPAYRPQYSFGGGDVSISAQGDIIHLTLNTALELVPDSSRQLPMNWLYRRGFVDPATGEAGSFSLPNSSAVTIASTTWWVDFSNFFEGIGALGGGNVSLLAGRDISNVDAVVPTNARMPKGRPDASKLVELGGGDLSVKAGRNIDAGVYYVERGQGELTAGNRIITNATRSPSRTNIVNEAPNPPQTWLPTTLFLGKGSFDVAARSDITMGPVANPFLLPGGFNNTYWYKTYFSTYAPDAAVNVTSTGGSIDIRQSATLPDQDGTTPLLFAWLKNVLLLTENPPTASFYQPWLRLNESSVEAFRTVATLLPGTFRATAFSGNVNLVGNLTLAPAPRGTLELIAGGAINGLQINGIGANAGVAFNSWGAARINVSDADPGALPSSVTPFANQQIVGLGSPALARVSTPNALAFVDNLFQETGSSNSVLQIKQTLHGKSLLHENDRSPVRLYAGDGDISGLTLFSPKATRIFAGHDVSDVAFYLQNVSNEDVSVVAAGRDIIAYNANSPLRVSAQSAGNRLSLGEEPLAGDIQLGGAGSLHVLAGRDLDLGTGANNADGTGTGIVTIGNSRNPNLSTEGAALAIGAGIGPSAGLAMSALNFSAFFDEVLTTPAGERHLAEVLGLTGERNLGSSVDDLFAGLSKSRQIDALLEVFYLTLRDAGRDHEVVDSPNYKKSSAYDPGFAAIDALFGSGEFEGEIKTRSRDIRTKAGGDLSIFAPGGGLRMASGNPDEAPLAPPGIVTETGGTVNIFTRDNVDIGIGRIFTLRGGDMVIWSSTGDIAAGSASKTVASAPPTRALIDPQSADVQTDLAGLSTGGGIGVLATVAGVPPGFVDLIAPVGAIDAGDAGIRATGAVNVAAEQVLNADNITAPKTTGVPVSAPPSAPNIAGLTSANTTAGAANSAADSVASQARQQNPTEEMPSTITVEVLGYGGDNESASLTPAGEGA